MKKYSYFLIGLFAVSSFTSCDDDGFLKEKPKSIYTVETAFDKSSQVDDIVTRAYIAFRNLHGWGNSYLGDITCNLLGGDGSDVIDATGQLSAASASMSNFMSLNANTDAFNNLWNDLYRLAAHANLAIYGAEQVSWSNDADKSYVLAQAKFFRGWAYLRLGECYGGVPIVDAYSENLKFDYDRTTRKETYEFAIANLEVAVAGLPDYPRQDGRVSKGAASHYLAEAYIALGTEINDNSYFTKAITAANVTIALHPLMTQRFGTRANSSDTDTSNGVANYRADGDVYYDLFQIGNYDRSEGNTESLMVVQTPTYEQFSSSGGDVFLFGLILLAPFRDLVWKDQYKESGASGGPWENNISLEGGSSCAYLGGNTWGLVGATDYSDDVVWQGLFATDIRNAQINRCNPVVLDEKHSMHGQIVEKEWLAEPSRHMRISHKITMQDGWGWTPYHIWNNQVWAYQFERDWYICRSSETYLLLAEAELRNENQAGAVEAINKIRERAQAVYMYDGSITLKDILDERARELAWEEHRWPTLLRLDSSTGNNDVMKYQLTHHTMYASDMGQSGITPSWTLFPIPTTVINLNSHLQLAQNPGW